MTELQREILGAALLIGSTATNRQDWVEAIMKLFHRLKGGWQTPATGTTETDLMTEAQRQIAALCREVLCEDKLSREALIASEYLRLLQDVRGLDVGATDKAYG